MEAQEPIFDVRTFGHLPDRNAHHVVAIRPDAHQRLGIPNDADASYVVCLAGAVDTSLNTTAINIGAREVHSKIEKIAVAANALYNAFENPFTGPELTAKFAM